MVATCGAGVTAAAGTSLTHHLFSKIFTLEKSLYKKYKHLGYPYHTFVHCKVLAPAAPRRARTSISVSFSGQPLSRPLLILGLVSHYLANDLISRRLILWHCFYEKYQFQMSSLIGFYLQVTKVIPNQRLDYRRVTEQSAGSLATP